MQSTATLPQQSIRDDPARAPWGWWEIGAVTLATLAAFAVTLLAVAFVFRALGLDVNQAKTDTRALIAQLAGQALLDAVAVGAAAYFSLRRFRLSPRAWGLRRDRAIDIGRAFGVLVLSFAALIGIGLAARIPGLGWLKPEENLPTELFDNDAVVPLTVLFVVVVAPVFEEMLFRGFLFNGLRRTLGLYGAALASGLLFAVIHVSSFDLVGLIVPFTIIGALFALLVAKTGSLWNAILVHATFNAISVAAALSSR